MLSAIKAKLLGAESLFSIWVIQQLRGPNFDHLPPRVGKHEHFVYYKPFVLVTPVDFLLTTYPIDPIQDFLIA